MRHVDTYTGIMAILFLLALTTAAFSHSGGCLKAEKQSLGICCHTDKKTGEKHCHHDGMTAPYSQLKDRQFLEMDWVRTSNGR